MSEVIGYSIVTHYADKTTQTTKMSAAQAAALVSVAGQRQGGKYEYINADECPEHGTWRAVPGGITKDGREYPAFWSCDTAKGEPRCTYRPAKEWVETHPPELPKSGPGEFDDLPF